MYQTGEKWVILYIPRKQSVENTFSSTSHHCTCALAKVEVNTIMRKHIIVLLKIKDNVKCRQVRFRGGDALTIIESLDNLSTLF